MTRPARTLALLAVALVTLTGCGSDPYPGQPEQGTLHVPLVNEMNGFDPTQADEEIKSACVGNVYDQLYEYHYLKRPFELVPNLAAAMPQVSADGLTYTIPLKRGVHYADDRCFPGGKGREMVASDVVFCLQRLMDARVNSPGTWLLEGYIEGLDQFEEVSAHMPERPNRSSYGPEEHARDTVKVKRPDGTETREEREFSYPAVAGLQAPDPGTVVIHLTKPYPEFVWVLAMPYMSVYPPEALATYGTGFREHPVTTGPYLLDTYFRAQKMVLVRNPQYRTDDLYPSEGVPEDRRLGRLEMAGRRLPLNDRVVATVFKETEPMWLYFESGYLDRTGIPKDNFATAIDEATGQLKGQMADRGVVLERDPRVEVIYDCFNFDDPVVGTKAGEKGRAIRRAMSLALDEEWARVNLYNNRVSRVDGPILKDFGTEYDPSFTNPWKRRPDETMEQARERARKVLADAGMPGGAGVPPLKADVTEDSTDQQFFVAFKEDMAKIGIRLQPYTVTWQELILRQREAKFQISSSAWGADYPAAQNFMQLFYGPNRSPNSNSSNYANPEYDALYDKALSLPAGPERAALYHKMQRIVVDDAVWIIRYRREQWTVRHAWLHGYKYDDISLKSYKYCWVEPRHRDVAMTGWNPVRWGPALIAAGALLVLVLVTLLAARRQVKGW